MRIRCSLVVLAVIVPLAAGAVQLNRPPQGLTGQGVVVDRALRTALEHPAWTAAARAHGFRIRDGRIQILADTSEPELTATWLETRNALHVLTSRTGRVQAWVEPAIVDQLAVRSEVNWVGRPDYIQYPEPLIQSDLAKSGSELTEGFEALNGPAWHAAGFTGAGVNVAVVDGGFEDYATLLGTDLPPVERVRFKAIGGTENSGSGNHGTACAEIVHDLAPDASIFLVLVSTNVDIENAMSWLANNGVQVVTMSLGFTTLSSGDGTGSLHDRIHTSVQVNDILWATSAGNSRQGHWQGQAADGDGDGWIEFAEGEEINWYARTISTGDVISPGLVWNDWTTVNQDYSLHLFRLNDDGEPEEVASADRSQNGGTGQRPSEQLRFTTSESGTYGLGIFRKSVTGVNDIEIFDADHDLVLVVEEGSLTIPADSPDILAVAAAGAGSPFAVRSYSSAGPTNGPGGSLDGGFLKPDIAGYDGVSTVTLGRFYGTSAASPHVGGAAALVRGAFPDWTVDEVTTFLLDRAIDKGTGGPDIDYGYGRLSLGTPPGSSCSYSVSPPSANHGATQSGGLIQISADDGCFWSAASNVSWIVVSPDSNSGNGFVAYTVLANSSVEVRQGIIEVAGHDFVVTQEGLSCSFLLTPDEDEFPPAGGDGAATVTTDVNCPWQATSDVSWISFGESNAGTGSGSLSYSVAENPDDESRHGTITVGDATLIVTQAGAGAGLFRTLVGGIAEAPGSEGTQWSSNLAVMNPGAEPATLQLFYRHAGGEVSRNVDLPAGAIVEWQAVAASFFGVTESSSGTVEVVSDQPVVVTARTFNQGETGSFGQFLPGVTSGEALPAGASGFLAPLASNDRFRTNIGFVNTGDSEVQATIRLFTETGNAAAVPMVVDVPAASWVQQNRVFITAGAGSCDPCFATVELSGDAWAYASVVDNDSGDPTTIPAVARREAGVGRRFMVAGVADADGANDTRWKSTLAVVNPDDTVALARVAYVHGGVRAETDLSFDGDGLMSWNNVVEELFAEPKSGGAVELTTSGALITTARTYNESEDGTFGQFLPAVEAAEAIEPGQKGLLTQLKSTDDFRTNIGFVNFSTAGCEAAIQLYDAHGTASGTALTVTVPAGGWAQKNGVFDAAGIDAMDVGYAKIQVMTSGCQLWAYASVVDNATGDPTTVPMIAID